jgi:hypothetical protein
VGLVGLVVFLGLVGLVVFLGLVGLVGFLGLVRLELLGAGGQGTKTIRRP